MKSSSGSSAAPCFAIAAEVLAERCAQEAEEDVRWAWGNGGGLPKDGRRDMLSTLADEDATDAATDGRRDIIPKQRYRRWWE